MSPFLLRIVATVSFDKFLFIWGVRFSNMKKTQQKKQFSPHNCLSEQIGMCVIFWDKFEVWLWSTPASCFSQVSF